jgi:SecD/SecF fusion protein
VDEYLKTAAQLKNCKLIWGQESEKYGYCLFALKTSDQGKPIMTGADVESIKIATVVGSDEPKIQIKLKSNAAPVFAEATKRNIDRSIAIVIDDKVYSSPVVRNAIEGGEIEVTGNFTRNEVNYFPALFNSNQLPLNFRVIK